MEGKIDRLSFGGVRKADTDYAAARETNLLRKRRASTLCVYKLFPIFREISIAFLFKITIARILFYAAVIIVTVVPSLYYVQKEKNPRILLDLRRQATDSLDLIFAKVQAKPLSQSLSAVVFAS